MTPLPRSEEGDMVSGVPSEPSSPEQTPLRGSSGASGQEGRSEGAEPDGFLGDLWDRADALEDGGMGDLAADIRHALRQYDHSRCAMGHALDSCGCNQNRILWNVPGEDIDEIVIWDVEMVHVEQMNARSWWIGIYLGDDKRWSGNFYADSRGRMSFSPQDDDVEWHEETVHNGTTPVSTASQTYGGSQEGPAE